MNRRACPRSPRLLLKCGQPGGSSARRSAGAQPRRVCGPAESETVTQLIKRKIFMSSHPLVRSGRRRGCGEVVACERPTLPNMATYPHPHWCAPTGELVFGPLYRKGRLNANGRCRKEAESSGKGRCPCQLLAEGRAPHRPDPVVGDFALWPAQSPDRAAGPISGPSSQELQGQARWM